MSGFRMFDAHLARWGLTPDGTPIFTASSSLLPVRRDGLPAMLKVAHGAEERAGARLMAWWDGDGAARVLAHEGDALLLERALGRGSLAEMARTGRDDEASRILCAAAAAGLERGRLLRWILAYTGLSAAWSMEDGDDPTFALAIAELASAELGMG